MAEQVEVTFTPSGRRGIVASGTSVLQVAQQLGVDLDTVCGGRGRCGRCQITVGERPGVPADPDRLGPLTATEAAYDGRRPLADSRRLGCAAVVMDDVVIDVPPESQVHRQVIRKDAAAVDVVIDPTILLRYVALPEATMADQVGELQRLREALQVDWGIADAAIDIHALRALRPALEAGRQGREHHVTVALREDADGGVPTIVAVWPDLVDQVHGVAVDVGSTTIAVHLVELTRGDVLGSTGRMNPQITYGEDLMSRVSYVMMNVDGQQRLSDVVQRALEDSIVELCTKARVDPGTVLDVVVVGNPIMHHLLLGLDPRGLGAAPFALATTDAVSVGARDIGLTAVHPGARVYAPPCIAGHVGADAAAAALAERVHERDELTLLVDVGTNAEIVLGDRHGVLAASSPTGPAFEGAQISSGQRAAPGAIERVRIDAATLVPRFKVIGNDAFSDDLAFHGDASQPITGICGSGIIEAIAELFLAGVIRTDGQLTPPADGDGDPQGRIEADGRTWRYRLVDADDQAGRTAVHVTQNDIRAIQLAKAALHAGCRLLMDHRGVEEVDRIRLAGAFGSHIDPRYALVLGLVPDCPTDKVTAAGNAAGQGALMCLLSAAARREVEALTRRIIKVETATEPGFQDHFVAAMGLPHSTAAYPHLAAEITLPTASAAAGAPGHRRRGRRASRPRPAAATGGPS